MQCQKYPILTNQHALRSALKFAKYYQSQNSKPANFLKLTLFWHTKFAKIDFT